MALPKIQPTDYANKGIRVKPNPLGLSVSDAQRAFDELSLDVVIPKVNEIAEAQDAVNKTFQLKETGKGLSENDFNNAYKAQLDNLPNDLNTKVDKVQGKQLSTFDYISADKEAVEDLKTALRAGKVLTDNNYTTVEKSTVTLIKDELNMGKRLTTNDYANEDKRVVTNLATDLSNGKQLSTNDYTNEDKAKLDDVVSASDVLPKTNTIPYSPTEPYNPATKKYVDDNVISGGVPSSRKINGYSLANDITLHGSDIPFIDDTTSTKYVIGFDNGGLYYKEVIS